ncbi:MAG: hypothetical protein J7498_05555 [Sphingobium sp.]|nr:hypothetical protein [Sphingobium sp.]
MSGTTNTQIAEKLDEVLAELAATKGEIEKLALQSKPVIEAYDAVAKTGKVLNWVGKVAVWIVAIAAAMALLWGAFKIAVKGTLS